MVEVTVILFKVKVTFVIMVIVCQANGSRFQLKAIIEKMVLSLNGYRGWVPFPYTAYWGMGVRGARVASTYQIALHFTLWSVSDV